MYNKLRCEQIRKLQRILNSSNDLAHYFQLSESMLLVVQQIVNSISSFNRVSGETVYTHVDLTSRYVNTSNYKTGNSLDLSLFLLEQTSTSYIIIYRSIFEQNDCEIPTARELIRERFESFSERSNHLSIFKWQLQERLPLI